MTTDEALAVAASPFHRSEDGYARGEAARVLAAEVRRLRAKVESLEAFRDGREYLKTSADK